MTVYNLKTPAPEPTEADILAAKKAEQEKNVKAVAKGIGVFVKPLVLMLLWNWANARVVWSSNYWIPESICYVYYHSYSFQK